MVWLCLALAAISLAISLPGTWLCRTLGGRMSAFDSVGVAGQVKEARRRVPNLGGIAIFWSFALPLLAAILTLRSGIDSPLVEMLAKVAPGIRDVLPGLAGKTGDALVLLAGLLILHIMGLFDDRKPLGPFLKLTIMGTVSLAVIVLTDSRLLTLLDSHAGGTWASIAVTLLWFLVVTNAMNFMDNMDGLSGGVGAIAAALFMAATLVHGQWFVAGCLALLLGSLMGFLHFNFPKKQGATIFMGDGGSLVLGFLLAFLTTRVTYVSESPAAGGTAPSAWYGVFMPLAVLAIPLYDFCSVVIIRRAQGRSPFVGDLQHFSHRLVRLGLSKRTAVLVIYGFTAMTGVSGVALASLAPWQAILVGVQILLLLAVLATLERGRVLNAEGGK